MPLKSKPIIVILRIESTNFSTCRRALEHLIRIMKQLQFPPEGTIIESEYWKLSVNKKLDLLNPKTMKN